ncbi:MAG: hypothetical protein FJ184_04500 [Gammaproteobacteria bacterium]|nr:hypothetical protein [Gammaproteobacteria bacterium]
MTEEIQLPPSSLPIAIDGPCFQNFLNELSDRITPSSLTDVRTKAEELVQRAVISYCAAFGSSDVGAAGTGIVSKRHTGAIPEGTNGLMYGRVQSGKTNASIASVALAAANGFRCFVVLTSDNTWLGRQTADRFAEQLLGDDAPIVRSWDQWSKDPKAFATTIREYVRDTGVVLVCTKNSSNLTNLITVLKSIRAADVPGLILDDEADNASLNINAAKIAAGKTTEPSKIFELIGRIREAMPNQIFVQVTATPQSLLLQGLDHPLRPAWHVLVQPGDTYVGGQVFFADDAAFNVPTTSDDLGGLKGGKVSPGDAWDMPQGLREAVCFFVTGGAVRALQNTKREVLSMLIHIAHTRVSHQAVQKTLRAYVTWLDRALRGKESATSLKKASDHIKKAYSELEKTCTELPSLEDVLTHLRSQLRNAQPDIIDADNPNRKPEYRKGYNFLIGGNRLGRGVTIEGLTVTYYARDAKTKMMDTVHQHARMFGYRRHLLPITRLYSPDQVLEALKDIHDSDEGTRSVIETPDGASFKPVWVGKNLKPTRAGVFNPADIRALAPGKALYPRAIHYKAVMIKSAQSSLDTMLAPYTNPDEYYFVEIEFLLEILSRISSDSNPSYDWDDNRVRLVLESLREQPIEIKKGVLNVARGPRRGHGESFSVKRKTNQPSGFAEGTQQAVASAKYQNYPLLLLRRQEGLKELGWDDQPFWAPTLVLPRTKFAFLFVTG